MTIDLSKPVLLRPDNFTPLRRTPWGGTVITTQYKDQVVPEATGRAVGESWEFSCDPQFPSRVALTDESLAKLIALHREDILGPRFAQDDESSICQILVKILDAAQPLSLQIHPRDDDSDLEPLACGKPESWLILQAEPGAGLYLGYNRPVARDELRKLLVSGDSAKGILQFVPVAAGDYFEIGPGVPHAIGAGITLLEPQRILPGKSGKTFRMWDWGRLYDEYGELDMAHGQPRELHIEASLKITDPQTQVGIQFVDSCRRQGDKREMAWGHWIAYPENRYYQVHTLDTAHTGKVTLSIERGYGVLLVLSGSVIAGEQEIHKGSCALLPHRCFPLAMRMEVQTKLALVVPAGAKLGF